MFSAGRVKLLIRGGHSRALSLLICNVLFAALLFPAVAADLPLKAQHSASENSIFFFAGRLSTSNMGSTMVFNAVANSTVLVEPHYDNYIVGAAYQHRFRELGYGFVLGGEIGIADRFGQYQVCCDIQTVKTSDIHHSGELWLGPTIRYEPFVLFNQLHIVPGIAWGFSVTTNSIGAERGREIAYNGSGRFLGYLGPEFSISAASMPNVELVLRLHHRSGAGGLFGKLYEGYNSNVFGLRYWY